MPDPCIRPVVLALVALLSFAGASAAQSVSPPRTPGTPPRPNLPTSPPSSEPPPPPPPPVTPPSDQERESLDADLALLSAAASRQVTISKDAKTYGELIESLAAQSGLPIAADWKSLEELGILQSDPPTLTRGSGSLLSVLEAIAANMGADYSRPRVEATLGSILLFASSKAVALRRTRVYQADALADAFLEQAQEHIDPDGWTRFGGDFQNATRFGGTVLVNAPPSIHHRLSLLLESLQLAHPSAMEMTAIILSVPTATFREVSMAADALEKLTPAALAKMSGVESVGTPTIIAAMDQTASMERTRNDSTLRLTFRPEPSADEGVLVHVHFEIDEKGAKSSSDGTLPAPLSGPPALLSLEIPGSDRSMVIFLRARPLPRPVAEAAK